MAALAVPAGLSEVDRAAILVHIENRRATASRVEALGAPSSILPILEFHPTAALMFFQQLFPHDCQQPSANTVPLAGILLGFQRGNLSEVCSCVPVAVHATADGPASIPSDSFYQCVDLAQRVQRMQAQGREFDVLGWYFASAVAESLPLPSFSNSLAMECAPPDAPVISCLQEYCCTSCVCPIGCVVSLNSLWREFGSDSLNAHPLEPERSELCRPDAASPLVDNWTPRSVRSWLRVVTVQSYSAAGAPLLKPSEGLTDFHALRIETVDAVAPTSAFGTSASTLPTSAASSELGGSAVVGGLCGVVAECASRNASRITRLRCSLAPLTQSLREVQFGNPCVTPDHLHLLQRISSALLLLDCCAVSDNGAADRRNAIAALVEVGAALCDERRRPARASR